MAQKRKRTHFRVKKDDRVFTLDVYIIGGPMTEEFIKRNKVICRAIQIRGDQTLQELHNTIFDAFDREDEHMYEFQVGGKRPMDPKARRYGIAEFADDPFSDDSETSGDAALTTIGSLDLKKGAIVGYWFDFGDDWWHRIDVVEIGESAGTGKYPRVTKRIGESPPQYIDWDDEDDE